MNDKTSYERYQRQMLLKEFGEEGQRKLLQAKALVIGAGGLGCPALQYLAAAGIGTIGIVDDDLVALSNLHRQVLYAAADVGLPKAERAAAVLRALNPDINIIAYNQRLTVENALELIRAFDIVIDGTDNFSTRYLVNDACVLLGKPLVYGAISQFEGQVSIFRNKEASDANYRDLFPQPPKEDEVLNCAEAGVLGVLPGIIGTMQANEAIKLLSEMGEPLVNRLLTYNALNNQFYELQLSAGKETRSLVPAGPAAFKQMNYEWLCASVASSIEIDEDQFDALLKETSLEIIDVRELHETPEVDEFDHKRIPLQQLAGSLDEINARTVLIFCQSGKRSKQAAIMLSDIFGATKKIYSLKGGIVNWKNQHMA